MDSNGIMVVFWLGLFIAVVSITAHLRDSNDISVGWKSDDVINNQVFVNNYASCADRFNGERMTGKQFKVCLLDSYTLALENKE